VANNAANQVDKSVATVMAEYIKAAKIPFIFAYPGDPIIEFMEASRALDIDIVLARREGTAAMMATGYAAATGNIGCVLSTLGPGSTNLVNGVAAANWDRLPMLAISGQIDTAREQYFTHQVVDHKLMFSPVTKWSGRVENGAVGTIMRKALRTATADRPGAVHLTVAEDVFKATAKGGDVRIPPLSNVGTGMRVVRAPGSSADPHKILANAKRPVFLSGIGAVRSGARDAMVALAEKTGIPVVTAPMSKGSFPEDHPLFAGVVDMACQQVMWDFLESADLIISVGFDCVELIKPWSATAPVLHIDSTENSDQIYFADCEMVGSIPMMLDWLREEWKGGTVWNTKEIETHKTKLRDTYYSGKVAGKLNPTDVVDVVRAAMPKSTVGVSDVGSHKMLIGQGWTTYEPRGLLMTNGLSSMGYGIPAAIAASLTDRNRPVVAMVGDGGFAMAATEIRLAAERKLPIVFVVFVDNSLNRIEIKQMVRGYPSTATKIEDSDLVKMAEAMHCDGARASSIAELERIMAGAAGITRPLVVEARIDPGQYEAQF
jgi:acetolactate synthase-1/2/3 large subunit